MTRARALDAARTLFILLTIGFAWWGFRGRCDDIAAAIAATGPVGLVAALALTMLGLALTAALWRHLLAGLGSAPPPRDAAAIFFVGQLGKYLPGSVWSFAAQARLGRRHQVPARRSVAASGLFLLLHTATGSVLGTAAALVGVLDVGGGRWLWLLATAGGLLLLLPPTVRRIGTLLAGTPVGFAARDLRYAALVMAAVWSMYGAAVLALLGPARSDLSDLAVVVPAFALSHVAGVLLVVAPAGLGAREAVLIALLEPVVGLDAAIAAALLARVVQTAADFTIAGLAALLAQRAHADTGLVDPVPAERIDQR